MARHCVPLAFLALLLQLPVPAARAEHVWPAGPRPALRHPGLRTVEDTLRIHNAHSQLAEVTLRLQGYGSAPLELAMPAWTPGAYHLVVPARNVQRLRARALAAGRPLAIDRVDRQTWRVQSPPAGDTVEVRYLVYLARPDVIRSVITDEDAAITGFDTFLYVVGKIPTPCELRIIRHRAWVVATGLRRTGPSSFSAPNYDVLIDCPLLWGRLDLRVFEVGGRKHSVVYSGKNDFDIDRMAADTRRIVEAVWPMFGGPLPYRDYWFLYRFHSRGGGGLEHLNSARMDVRPAGYGDPDAMDRYWSLTSHEFLHAWNVKRIRPNPLGPFDYTQEQLTPYLWFCEGVTSYLGDLALVRADLWSTKRYLQSLAEAFVRYQRRPARAFVSLEDASRSAWYPPENFAAAGVDYYNKGKLVGALLDLRLRRETGGRQHLDGLMRSLYADFRRTGLWFEPGAVRAAAERLTGQRLGRFFEQYVAGTAPLPLGEALHTVGLDLIETPGRKAGTLGVRVHPRSARVVFIEGGSAAARAGLREGDVVVALAGRRVDGTSLPYEVVKHSPGERTTVTVFRGDRLVTLPVVLGTRTVTGDPTERARFRKMPLQIAPRTGATESEVAEQRRWLSARDDRPAPPPL